MFTPYRLLIVVLAALTVFGAGAYLGYQYCDGRHAKASTNAQNAAIERFRQQAEADKQEAIDRVRRETMAQERADSAKRRGVNDATLKAKPGCDRDAASVSLLHDAINAANGPDSGPGSVPEGVPKDTGTKIWKR